ncbi:MULTISPECIES: OprO/OprP family phosphate-selective porin [Shewanella]|uniref:OprO/OprP family phosphate-selective porin n=1 Tax=Shewanella TaxID=22 RepID=UPI0006D683D7|nr:MULTISPECIES: porin [Shewanella]KPZ71280.1 Porin P precursor [Shewanella sp. P1-14-1]MBQ4891875.1 carbohydrate porin [Shewanella sp. MMG014]OBT04182.1 porin [Shewanella sp. UCD-FRSSP16_17]
MSKENVFSVSGVAKAVAISLFCFSGAAMAADSDRVTELEERLDALEMELIEAKDAANQTDRLTFSSSSPSPEFISKDGKSTMEFSGRIQLDYVNSDDFYTGSKREFEGGANTVDFRRVRFGVEGYFSNVWKYSLEFDFDGESEVEVKDANVSYRGWENQELEIGFQKFGFGLEATGSSAHLAFLERASTDTFSPDRNVGVQWLYKGNDYNLMLGLGTTANINDDDLNFKQDVYNGRFTMAPINTSDHLLHIGVSGMYTNNNSEAEEMRYRARPSSKPVSRTIDTGKFDAESVQSYGLELAYQHRNLLIQGEYVTSKADQVDDESVSVDAYYLQAVYTLTGEQWNYGSKKGTFKSVKPENAISAGGYGAWEIAARVDVANFDDTDADIYGGEKTDYIVGVNWYLENNLKAQFNYVRSQSDYKQPYTDINGVEMYDQDGNIFQARLQFAF